MRAAPRPAGRLFWGVALGAHGPLRHPGVSAPGLHAPRAGLPRAWPTGAPTSPAGLRTGRARPTASNTFPVWAGPPRRLPGRNPPSFVLRSDLGGTSFGSAKSVVPGSDHVDFVRTVTGTYPHRRLSAKVARRRDLDGSADRQSIRLAGAPRTALPVDIAQVITGAGLGALRITRRVHPAVSLRLRHRSPFFFRTARAAVERFAPWAVTATAGRRRDDDAQPRSRSSVIAWSRGEPRVLRKRNRSDTIKIEHHSILDG